MTNPIETWTAVVSAAAEDYALAVRQHDKTVRRYEADRCPQIDVRDSRIRLAQARTHLKACIRESLIDAYATGSTVRAGEVAA